MKRLISKLMVTCLLAVSLHALAQSTPDSNQEAMKHDDMKQDTMKHDDMAKDDMGMAKAPTANTGASFSNSRRETFLNLRELIRASMIQLAMIQVAPASRRLSGGRPALRSVGRRATV